MRAYESRPKLFRYVFLLETTEFFGGYNLLPVKMVINPWLKMNKKNLLFSLMKFAKCSHKNRYQIFC